MRKKVKKQLEMLPQSKTVKGLRDKIERTDTLSKRDLKILQKLVNDTLAA